MADGPDVKQGALALTFLETRDVLGPLPDARNSERYRRMQRGICGLPTVVEVGDHCGLREGRRCA